jgi:two-component system phosphate regulon sensor histidine kinase PhoR
MWRSRMFWQVFVAYGALVLVSLGLLGFFITRRVEQDELRQVEERLRGKALLVREAVRGQRGDRGLLAQRRLHELYREVPGRVTLIGHDGRVLADSAVSDLAALDPHPTRPEVVAARTAPFGVATRHSTTLGRTLTYVAVRMDEPDSPVAFVRVALPVDDTDDKLAAVNRLVWVAAAVTAALALALAFWLARRVTRPLTRLTRTAEFIAAGGYGHKVYAESQDEVGQLAGAFNRMSKRLAAQFAQLDEDRQQLRAVLSSMTEGVVAIDAEQRILFANDRAGQLLDFPARAAVGRRLWEVVRQRALQDVVEKALTRAEFHRQELRWDGPAARSVTVHVGRLSGTPPRGAVLVFHDTTELRRLESLRQEFVANVSHELKTPLAVIQANVETLMDGAADDPQHRGTFLKGIADQADRLHTLILDMLSLARIESGTEAFVFQAVALDRAVAECLQRHHGRAEAKGLQLVAVPPTHGTPAVAWADEEAVGQILDNLVDNALKYTRAAGVIIVRWWAEDGLAALEVEDTGIGIAEHDLPRIFERFYRVDKARSRELGGTGLGLAIVKHLAQAMRGSVSAASRLGHGTTFTVRLPAGLAT